MAQGRRAIGPGEVHVWLARVDVRNGEADLRRCAELLTRGDCVRSERFRVPEQRRRSLMSRALTRFALSRYREVSPRAWRFSTSSLGRPLVEGEEIGGLCFNLSSTPGLVTCAIAQASDLGVDIEAVDGPASLDLIDRLFTPAEAEDIRSQPREHQLERFVDFWSLKESYLKARGVGFGASQPRFGFRLGRRIALSHERPAVEEKAAWSFRLWSPTPAHRAAVAFRGRPGVPVTLVQRWWHG